MRMSAGLRKLMLTVHITASVGWVGAVIAYLALDITTVASDDAATLRAAYVAMQLIAQWALIPLAWTALITGLVVSLGTSWGLFRHYWVIISLVLTFLAALILQVEMQTIRALATIASDPATSVEGLRSLPSTLPHSIGGLVVLIVVLALNVYKPRGVTRYGWRKQREERATPES